MPSIHLKPEGGRALLRRHPWIFSGAIARIEGDPAPGETVEVIDSRGHFLARAAYSPHSQIAARVWTFDPDEPIGASFFRSRIEKAVSRRLALIDEGSTDALRLVNAEADGIPGLVVDRYASWIVCQITSTGPERWREEIVSALVELLSPDGIYERSDASVRSKEGLDPRTGVLAGAEPPDLVETREGALRFLVDVKEGHKTGFYLDQRENRAIAAAHASGAEVLNAFAYTGAFAVAALRA
ncbi:MAG: class I SAM-dependent rRNA methyltransferase, partial [Candidatus Latescibacterota bacterium]